MPKYAPEDEERQPVPGELRGDNIICFTAGTGRSGTTYLYRMLHYTEQCYSSHEYIVGDLTKSMAKALANNDPDSIEVVDTYWKEKSIPRLNAYSDKPYFDSDGRFIISAYRFAFRDIPHDRLKIIILTRSKVKTIKSLYAHGGGRFSEEKGLTGAIPYPHGVLNVTKPHKPMAEMTRIDICTWAVFEVAERQKRIKEVYPDIDTFHWDMDTDPPSFERWMSLLSFLGLNMTDNLVKLIKKNPVINPTHGNVVPCSIEEVEDSIANYRKIMNDQPRPAGVL